MASNDKQHLHTDEEHCSWIEDLLENRRMVVSLITNLIERRMVNHSTFKIKKITKKIHRMVRHLAAFLHFLLECLISSRTCV
jgi:chemotaxis protein histidine kinase CheA